MNNPAASCGYQNYAMRIIFKASSPNVFYRGSTMLTTTLSQVEWVGGPVRIRLDFTSASSVWRAQSSHRSKHVGMTEFGETIHSTQQAAGIDPKKFKDAI
jgi:hypothetical protein